MREGQEIDATFGGADGGRTGVATWQRRQLATTVAADAVAMALAWYLTYLAEVTLLGWELDPTQTVAYLAGGLLAVAGWVLVIGLRRGYDRRFIGISTDEYRRVPVALVQVLDGRKAVLGVGHHGPELADPKRRAVEADSRLLFKIRDDPRLTPVGRFLRRWSLDELPQLVERPRRAQVARGAPARRYRAKWNATTLASVADYG